MADQSRPVFIYSAAPSPAIAAAALAAVDFLASPEGEEEDFALERIGSMHELIPSDGSNKSD
jgi:7-keto-8-aminopelargonate synthetase-like enzyme